MNIISYAAYLENIAKVRDSFKDIVVPLYVADNKINGKFNCFGSGFIISRKGRQFIVTAAHVVKEIKKMNEPIQLLTIVNGTQLDISWGCFIINDVSDLAVMPINRVVDMRAINVDANEFSVEETGVAYGFPATINKLGRFNKSSIIMVISTCMERQTGEENYYHYDRKKMLNNLGEKKGNSPDLHGMSGGPLLNIHCNNDLGVTFSLAGIITRQEPQNKLLVVKKAEQLVHFLDRVFFDFES
jgi:hypothetical protein